MFLPFPFEGFKIVNPEVWVFFIIFIFTLLLCFLRNQTGIIVVFFFSFFLLKLTYLFDRSDGCFHFMFPMQIGKKNKLFG